MARRQRTSDAEAIVLTVGRLLPWWVCLALAVVAYVTLHAYAVRPLPPPDPKRMAGLMQGAVLRGLATGGQYIVPTGLVVAALVSLVGRRRRQTLLQSATGSNGAQGIAGLTWQEFELLVGEGFRQQGYQVAERTRGGADGGVDLVLRKGGEMFLVQAKHWKAFKVGVEVVRGLYGVMAAEGAAGGFVVTSGRFTDEAATFATGRNVRLVDGPKLDALLKQARASRSTPPPMPAPSTTAAEPAATASPSCPFCSRHMVLREARRGAKAGKSFWGCSGFSAGCRGTRDA